MWLLGPMSGAGWPSHQLSTIWSWEEECGAHQARLSPMTVYLGADWALAVKNTASEGSFSFCPPNLQSPSSLASSPRVQSRRQCLRLLRVLSLPVSSKFPPFSQIKSSRVSHLKAGCLGGLSPLAGRGPAASMPPLFLEASWQEVGGKA